MRAVKQIMLVGIISIMHFDPIQAVPSRLVKNKYPPNPDLEKCYVAEFGHEYYLCDCMDKSSPKVLQEKMCDGHRDCNNGSDEEKGCKAFLNTPCRSKKGLLHIECPEAANMCKQIANHDTCPTKKELILMAGQDKDHSKEIEIQRLKEELKKVRDENIDDGPKVSSEKSNTKEEFKNDSVENEGTTSGSTIGLIIVSCILFLVLSASVLSVRFKCVHINTRCYSNCRGRNHGIVNETPNDEIAS